MTGSDKHSNVEDIFRMVVQVVLLFGLDMWMITPHMGRSLGSFQNRVAFRPTERHQCRLWF